ncbi:acyl-CoA-binding domain-containing protein 4 [Dorcoceras hygrometricum]|uniref:Acyl-CoA-binding domain-containing protein 4 n=1 Tax=Dorcoceras hygrometricum TaxID=472368 RepID=A0A2Z7CX68_9LAMI|nr:acyl-CoA-binding domain-containing protein 4 [Dorcoceras hygrometricum]
MSRAMYADSIGVHTLLMEDPVPDIDSRSHFQDSWAQWADVCVDVVQFSLLGSLCPVGSVNICRDIVIHSSAVDILERLPNSFCGIFQQGQDTNSFVGYFSDSVVRPVLQSLPDVDLVSFDGSTVYRSPSSQSVSSKSFHDTESTEPNVQDTAFRGMIKNIRQEAHNDTDVFSIKLEAVRTQNVILRTELADVRQEVKAQKAELYKELDERLATIRSELDFHAQAQENCNTLSTQLGFLVDYINRGGDDKNGEGGSNLPQPPPDDQNRPSGGSASRGGGSSRRDDRRDSSKKRRSSSGGGGSGTGGESDGPYGPYKKDAKYWLF